MGVTFGVFQIEGGDAWCCPEAPVARHPQLDKLFDYDWFGFNDRTRVPRVLPLHIERFPLIINDMPIRPLIREATRGPRFGGKGVEEADDGAEVQAVVLRENVSLVPPDEPEEPTPVEGEEEVDQFVAFGPIEDFQPDWGGTSRKRPPKPSKFPKWFRTLLIFRLSGALVWNWPKGFARS